MNEIILKLLNKRNRGHLILNICSNKAIKITKIIYEINKYVNKKNLHINKINLQKADVVKTHGQNKKVKELTNFKNFTSIKSGIKFLTDWYKKDTKN